jgi:hypothetical protein
MMEPTGETTPELVEKEIYIRGTHHKKPFLLEEGDCLSEYALIKEVLERQQKRWAYIDTICGTVKRLLVKVWIFRGSKAVQVFADVITGTVYSQSGECLSSHKRRIVKWGAYESTKDKNKLKTNTNQDFNWNEGV